MRIGGGDTTSHVLRSHVTVRRLVVHPVDLRGHKLEEVFPIGTSESHSRDLDIVVEGEFRSGDWHSRTRHREDFQGSECYDIGEQRGTS